MFLLIDKPKGSTSHDVVDQVRKVTGIRRVGHAGTLDPNATGLLIVGVGRESTKKLGALTTNTNKTYTAEIILGEERDTDDAEGEILHLRQPQDQDDKVGLEILPTLSNIKDVVKSFEGEQEQVPPAYSAIKLQGRKAYELARQGRSISLSPRKVHVYTANLIDYDYPILRVEFEVSSGTYIRALARDIGRDLGTFGYLGNLRRTKIGKFSLDKAVDLDKLNGNNWESFAVEL